MFLRVIYPRTEMKNRSVKIVWIVDEIWAERHTCIEKGNSPRQTYTRLGQHSVVVHYLGRHWWHRNMLWSVWKVLQDLAHLLLLLLFLSFSLIFRFLLVISIVCSLFFFFFYFYFSYLSLIVTFSCHLLFPSLPSPHSPSLPSPLSFPFSYLILFHLLLLLLVLLLPFSSSSLLFSWLWTSFTQVFLFCSLDVKPVDYFQIHLFLSM